MTAANHPMAWADQAACKGEDPAMFFPDTGGLSAQRYSDAVMEIPRAICPQCPVFVACHAWAVKNETEGIWAGTDPAQRRRIRRSLGIAAPDKTGGPDRHNHITGLIPTIEEVDMGRSAAETARALGVSKRTVNRHRAAQRTA